MPRWSASSLVAHSLCWFCHEAAQIMIEFLYEVPDLEKKNNNNFEVPFFFFFALRSRQSSISSFGGIIISGLFVQYLLQCFCFVLAFLKLQKYLPSYNTPISGQDVYRSIRQNTPGHSKTYRMTRPPAKTRVGLCAPANWSVFTLYMSLVMRSPVLCHMRTTKAHINLRIGAVWSEPLLFAA